MPILTCIFFTFNWLTLTSETHFVKFHPEVASCLPSRGKRKYAPLGMRLIWKYIRNYFLVYQLISHFLSYLQNYKEFKAQILDLQPEKYGLSFNIKKCTTSGWALGDENVIGIRPLISRGHFTVAGKSSLLCLLQQPVYPHQPSEPDLPDYLHPPWCSQCSRLSLLSSCRLIPMTHSVLRRLHRLVCNIYQVESMMAPPVEVWE